MSILRVYDPADCDERGVPLDWECCRTCKGAGEVQYSTTPGIDPRDPACETREDQCGVCDGHGSLRAAALAEKEWRDDGWALVRPVAPPHTHRCESCGHPMSEGTWEYDTAGWRGGKGEWCEPAHPTAAHVRLDEHALAVLREGQEPTMYGVHYSSCDEGCRHYGLAFDEHGYLTADPPVEIVRPVPEGTDSDVQIGPLIDEGYGPYQASWRPVDVRTSGWPHDLRPEKLAVLCLRCFAERSAA